jgi:hypothetical protein
LALTLFSCPGGHIVLPDRSLVLADRLDGGNLVINPPRDVWERSELTLHELTQWSCLVAATGRAMIDVLPQLSGGCVNYWEAGNWALNALAEPVGQKNAVAHRKVHLHLLGRSRQARQASHQWGEAPKFPDFVDRHAWAAAQQRLTACECTDIVAAVVSRLQDHYGFAIESIKLPRACAGCGYPVPVDTMPADLMAIDTIPVEQTDGKSHCSECRAVDADC